jgi:hypothetical protein
MGGGIDATMEHAVCTPLARYTRRWEALVVVQCAG